MAFKKHLILCGCCTTSLLHKLCIESRGIRYEEIHEIFDSKDVGVMGSEINGLIHHGCKRKKRKSTETKDLILSTCTFILYFRFSAVRAKAYQDCLNNFVNRYSLSKGKSASSGI